MQTSEIGRKRRSVSPQLPKTRHLGEAGKNVSTI
jgi:hypothetical protein